MSRREIERRLQLLLARFERRAGVQLPAPVRAYLKAANGMASEMDDERFCFWPLDRWESHGDEQMFVFADYMDWSWAYGLWLGSDANHGSVWLLGGSPDRQVAHDFEEFFDRYVLDDAAILC
jgi:hypothetical protein